MHPSNKASISMEMKNNYFLITQITHFMIMITITNRFIVM